MKVILVILLLVTPSFAVKVSVANIAAATTIAVNADLILKIVRHPKKTVKDTGSKIKQTIKGK